MNKELRINETEERKVYFISDTHFNHNKDFVYGVRGFKNVTEHNDVIFAKINEIVRPNDILFHLGDFCLNTDEDGFNAQLARINCQNIHYLWGNHNNPLWSIYKREVSNWFAMRTGTEVERDEDFQHEIYPFNYRNICFMGNYLEATINGHKFVMAHYPIYVYNFIKNGAKHLCGHSHGGLDLSDEHNLNTKTLDVGWDDFGKPLSFDEVLTIMNKKSIFVPSDHHKKVNAVAMEE